MLTFSLVVSLNRACFYNHIPIYCPKEHYDCQKYVIKQELKNITKKKSLFKE